MQNFITLEGGYLAIAAFVLLVALFVSTRSFMAKGSFKKALLYTFIVLALFIGGHYYVTTNRMVKVSMAFEQNKEILCESRMLRKVAQSVIIQKSNEWTLKDNLFTSPNYTRGFHSARCIVK
jgi:hypothetical protein